MLRLAFHCLVALLPWWLKNPAYRLLCGYRIGQRVRIGISPILAGACSIEDDVRIGHFNVFWKTGRLEIGGHVRIGPLNLFRGGERIQIGRYAEILRGNVVNSIVDPDVETPTRPEFRLGDGSVVTTGHWIDFTDRVSIGVRSILGGRNSSIWTHNRQWTREVSIGDFVYLGSEVRLAPGAAIPSFSVVGLGSVIVDVLPQGKALFAGNPARAIKVLDERGFRLLTRPTRRDLPEDVGLDLLESLEQTSAIAGMRS